MSMAGEELVTAMRNAAKKAEGGKVQSVEQIERNGLLVNTPKCVIFEWRGIPRLKIVYPSDGSQIIEELVN